MKHLKSKNVIAFIVLIVISIFYLQVLESELSLSGSEAWAMQQDSNELESLSPDELRQVVEAYIQGQQLPTFLQSKIGMTDDTDIEPYLVGSAPRTFPVLIELLKSKSLDFLIAECKHSPKNDSPIERVCRLFETSIPTEAVKLIDRFRAIENREIRLVCASAVSNFISVESAPYVLEWLDDSDSLVRYVVISNLSSEQVISEIGSKNAASLSNALEVLIQKNLSVEEAAELLVKVDKDKAQRFLVSSVLESSGDSIVELLRVIRTSRIALERDQVQLLLKSFGQRPSVYPNNRVVGELLRILGAFRNADDYSYINSELANSDEIVKSGAADGLLEWYGFRDFRRKFWDICKTDGAVSDSMKYYLAVQYLEDEVLNGGFDQYFFNSAGDDWKLALEGLHVMKLPKRAKLLGEAVALFGSKGPSVNRSLRQLELEKISPDSFDALGSIGSLAESFAVASARFVVSNSEDFVLLKE